MKKIDGLKFLINNFPEISLNSLFVNEIQDLEKNSSNLNLEEGEFWRVRCAHQVNAELALPMISIYNKNDLFNYVNKLKTNDNNLQFIIHKVDNIYFYPQFCGTLAVYMTGDIPKIIIELQKVSKEMIDSMDVNKVRPRDWPICVSIEYNYLHGCPQINMYDNVNMELLKSVIYQLFNIGRKIYDIYEENHLIDDSYTRFNIYNDGSIILNDHRGIDSFVKKKK